MIIINLFATIYAVSPSLVPKLNANHINWFDRFISKYVFHCFFMLKVNQLMNVIRWIVVSKQNKTEERKAISWILKNHKKKTKKVFFLNCFWLNFLLFRKNVTDLFLEQKKNENQNADTSFVRMVDDIHIHN